MSKRMALGLGLASMAAMLAGPALAEEPEPAPPAPGRKPAHDPFAKPPGPGCRMAACRTLADCLCTCKACKNECAERDGKVGRLA